MKDLFKLLLLGGFFLVMTAGCGKAAEQENAPLSYDTQPLVLAMEDHANEGHSPLYLVIFQLSQPLPFTTLSFTRLSRAGAEALGESYIGSTAYYLQPNQRKTLHVGLLAKTRYLGIFADYKKMNAVRWRTLIRLKKHRPPVQVILNFTRQGLVLSPPTK